MGRNPLRRTGEGFEVAAPPTLVDECRHEPSPAGAQAERRESGGTDGAKFSPATLPASSFGSLGGDNDRTMPAGGSIGSRSDVRTGAVAASVGAALLALAAMLGACSAMGDQEKKPVEIWRSGEQFVRIEPPEVPETVALPPNVHPVRVSADQLRNGLRRIGVRHSPGDEPRPLFEPASLEALGRGLEAGLARARPDQDVTFAVEQRYRGFLGLTDTRVISGRMFYSGGWLHLIFGSVLREDVADDDLHFDPYRPGRRYASERMDVTLWAAPGAGVYRAPGVERDDWLVFAPQALAARPPAPPAPPPAYWPR